MTDLLVVKMFYKSGYEIHLPKRPGLNRDLESFYMEVRDPSLVR